MKLFKKGLDIDKFTETVMSDEELEDIDDDFKRSVITSFARGFNNAYGIMSERIFVRGMFIGAILCTVGSVIGESIIKSRKK